MKLLLHLRMADVELTGLVVRILQLMPDVKKAIETMNPVYSVREDVSSLEISFPKCVVVGLVGRRKLRC
jgi:hypothetical protein